jgi:hypothetical protein
VAVMIFIRGLASPTVQPDWLHQKGATIHHNSGCTQAESTILFALCWSDQLEVSGQKVHQKSHLISRRTKVSYFLTLTNILQCSSTFWFVLVYSYLSHFWDILCTTDGYHLPCLQLHQHICIMWILW